MVSHLSQQYAFCAQSSLGLVGGTPDYIPLWIRSQPAPAPTTIATMEGCLLMLLQARVYRLVSSRPILRSQFTSPAMRCSSLPGGGCSRAEPTFPPGSVPVRTKTATSQPLKLEDGAQHKNLRTFSVSTGRGLIAFTQKSQKNWDLQYTISISHAVRLVSQEVQVFRPADATQHHLPQPPGPPSLPRREDRRFSPTHSQQALPFGRTIPPAPHPSLSVLVAALTPKPTAAYRSPGARGLATAAIFKCEDEGGARQTRLEISRPTETLGMAMDKLDEDTCQVLRLGHLRVIKDNGRTRNGRRRRRGGEKGEGSSTVTPIGGGVSLIFRRTHLWVD
ncbi:hypothetical protein J3R83DRAFT_1604 [Lanmaoa asiatica]|nr:hypothetical protein J3R83DRAFT_1604 [Lanmaoa asiatica]